ncbi:hypothetical protein ALC56_12978 [Trachymyrmex septentrionalis]|uniref:Uncharacterized protein n=1 Tax=Trachymyrmex septentrionalis TaxID=34720 RepID=A0A195EXU6_9HYME|nr:hypothetical protein ALC56_12978 [Trachymyrmex septentrionalis]
MHQRNVTRDSAIHPLEGCWPEKPRAHTP